MNRQQILTDSLLIATEHNERTDGATCRVLLNKINT